MFCLGKQASIPYDVYVNATLKAVELKYRLKASAFLEAPYNVRISLNNGAYIGEQLVNNSSM